MHGTLIQRECGEPVATGDLVTFDHTDVVAFGKVTFLGQARIPYIVRLRDGREFFVKASRQKDIQDSAWLYGLSKKVKLHHYPNLSRPCIETWLNL